MAFTFRFGRMSFLIQPVRCADSVDFNDGTDIYYVFFPWSDMYLSAVLSRYSELILILSMCLGV